MGFRSARRSNTQETDAVGQTASQQQSRTRQEVSTGAVWTTDTDRAEQQFGMRIPDDRTLQRLQIAAETHGQQVHDWIDEGMPAEILGKTRDMKAFRQRQADRPPEVPTNIERRNKQSVHRSEKAAAETGSAGVTGVPEPVRDVISSSGRSLDASIQRAMEDRMGDSFCDVQIHTGATAAAACESINARAFTVGNHIAFNQGEYDPGSPEGQHVLAHELAHVRQQTGGAVSMLPQEDVDLEIDPDPALEREAEETAQQVMEGGKLDIQRMADTDVHVQRAGLGSMDRGGTWSPGQNAGRATQSTEQEPIKIEVDEIEADPEALAAEVQQIKANQQLVMETLTDAKPGSSTEPGAGGWAKTALKGVVGSLASTGAGAALGTMLGGPGVGTAVGAAAGASLKGLVGDLTKRGIDYAGDQLSGSKAQELDRKYEEMKQMYKELKQGRQTGGENPGRE